jgi:2-aminomuconate deaminase
MSTSNSSDKISTNKAPEPVGAYPHARRVGELLFLSGVGPRKPGTKEIPGVKLNQAGEILEEDIVLQTESVIENIKVILEASGSSFDKIVDVQVFLTNMKRDFKKYNDVYAKYFTSVGATRTTIEINALPTPICVEFKVIATV